MFFAERGKQKFLIGTHNGIIFSSFLFFLKKKTIQPPKNLVGRTYSSPSWYLSNATLITNLLEDPIRSHFFEEKKKIEKST